MEKADSLYNCALENLKLAAESGSADAQSAYGIMQCVLNDLDNGISWLQKAASQKHDKGMCNLASYYLSGEIPRNKERAFELLEEGLSLNLPACIRSLALHYIRGEEVTRNLDIASEFFEEVPAKGLSPWVAISPGFKGCRL